MEEGSHSTKERDLQVSGLGLSLVLLGCRGSEKRRSILAVL